MPDFPCTPVPDVPPELVLEAPFDICPPALTLKLLLLTWFDFPLDLPCELAPDLPAELVTDRPHDIVLVLLEPAAVDPLMSCDGVDDMVCLYRTEVFPIFILTLDCLTGFLLPDSPSDLLTDVAVVCVLSDSSDSELLSISVLSELLSVPLDEHVYV